MCTTKLHCRALNVIRSDVDADFEQILFWSVMIVLNHHISRRVLCQLSVNNPPSIPAKKYAVLHTVSDKVDADRAREEGIAGGGRGQKDCTRAKIS